MVDIRLPKKTVSQVAYKKLEAAVTTISKVILGKEQQIRLALACLVAKGHLLIEDLPGMGKTTLSHVIAQVMGLDFQRIQFTNDLLPSDIVGISVFERDQGTFEFHPGPVFSNLLLADEINRATPKTQSALLEAMEEQQVTVDGVTRPLPEPFFVVATQNPAHQIGTFALPESQLDRFLLKIKLGYPSRAVERELLSGADRRGFIEQLTPVFSPQGLKAIQQQATVLPVSDALLDYIQAIIDFSRQSAHFEFGLSPRGGLALLNMARAWAMISKHDFVVPEHVKEVLPAVVNHRLSVVDGTQKAASLIANAVPIP